MINFQKHILQVGISDSIKYLSFQYIYITIKYSIVVERIKFKIFIFLIIINIFIICFFYKYNYVKNFPLLFERKINSYNFDKSFSIEDKEKYYSKKKFAIIKRFDCPDCGFFSFYIVHLGCISYYLSKGYIPIVDLQSFKNVYNNGNITKNNPWENFFYQPFNYTLEEVKKNAKIIKNFECVPSFYRPNEINIYYDKNNINFWHNFALRYMPLKNELINEAKIIMHKLFNNSKNILGVKLRGTDYLSSNFKKHSIPPKVEQVIFDVKSMDKKYKYDYIFFATEDELIKRKFCLKFGNKLKLLNPNVFIKYDYKTLINISNYINGNLDYIKNYVLNIIVLSNCLDIIMSRCNGAAGIFILSNGFRHTKIYNLGVY